MCIIYTVETVERLNANTVLVGIVGGDIASGIIYEPGDTVSVEALARWLEYDEGIPAID